MGTAQGAVLAHQAAPRRHDKTRPERLRLGVPWLLKLMKREIRYSQDVMS